MPWEETELAKRDGARVVKFGFLVICAVVVLSIAVPVFVLLSTGPSQAVMFLLTAVTAVLFLVAPSAYFALITKDRRKDYALASGLDLTRAFPVKLEVRFDGQPIGMDDGFLVLQPGAFAFVGSKCRVAYALDTTEIKREGTFVSCENKSLADRELVFWANDRFLGRALAARRIFCALQSASNFRRPTKWFDVHPPEGIEPDLEVTIGKVKAHRRYIAVVVFSGAIAGVSIGYNLYAGNRFFEGPAPHAIFMTIMAIVTGVTTVSTERARFAAHDRYRSIQQNGTPLKHPRAQDGILPPRN